VLGNRNMTDEKFQAVVLDELAALKQGLALERWAAGGGMWCVLQVARRRLHGSCAWLCAAVWGRAGQDAAQSRAMHHMYMLLLMVMLGEDAAAGMPIAPVPAVLTLLLCWCTPCREERVAEDDEIVQAVNDYTRALQDGLRLVNTT
jgi:hypothetical protein